MGRRNRPDLGGRFSHLIVLLAALILIFTAPPPVAAQREHIVHFSGTPYELHVYKIFGHKPGKTLMLIGGIQGNEPGGFLSADLYADMTLEKGNLIVIPRANFYSIMLNERGPNGDMNRKFNKTTHRDHEIKIVTILKSLMAESDLMLNLHDGSGFFRPRYISSSLNPKRFGQSIIADAEEYVTPKSGKTLRLGEMARQVCQEINSQIDNPLYHFRFNNHRTMEPDSPNLEQRGSATYYALNKVGIPAFGVETSKSLPTIELKVRHHNLAINSFMKIMGIIPEHPSIKVEKPALRYLVVTVNGGQPLVVDNKKTLSLKRGDTVFISHIEANYERGLSLDILGLGGLNDARQKFVISHPTSVVVRKDHQQCGWIRLGVKDGPGQRPLEANPLAQYFVIEVNGQERLVANGQVLDLIRGDRLRLLATWTSTGQRGVFAINFKGFVSSEDQNTGDDRKTLIQTDQRLMKKWSVRGKGERYRIVAEKGKNEFGEIYVRLTEPVIDYLIVQAGKKTRYAVSPGETLLLENKSELKILDAKANFDAKDGLKFVLKTAGNETPLALGQTVREKTLKGIWNREGKSTELVAYRNHTVVGSIYIALRPLAADAGETDKSS